MIFFGILNRFSRFPDVIFTKDLFHDTIACISNDGSEILATQNRTKDFFNFFLFFFDFFRNLRKLFVRFVQMVLSKIFPEIGRRPRRFVGSEKSRNRSDPRDFLVV